MSNLATTMTISGFLEVGAGARPRVEGVNDVFSNQLWRFTLGELRGAVLCFHAFYAATPFYCEAPEMFCGLRNSIWLSISVEGGEDDWMLVFRLYCSWWVAFIVCMMNHISQRAKRAKWSIHLIPASQIENRTSIRAAQEDTVHSDNKFYRLKK